MSRIVIDELVLRKDFMKIDLRDQRKTVKAIRQKLTTKPEDFGEPRRGELRRFWKLRVGGYRVIYETQEDQALTHVLPVGFRRDEEVFQKALSRFRVA